MEKEDILAISRRENKNRDLAEAEISAQAGSIASRIGAGNTNTDRNEISCTTSNIGAWYAGIR